MAEATAGAPAATGEAAAGPPIPRSTLLLAVVLLAIVRVGYLWANDLWFDDIFTYEISIRSLEGIAERTAEDVHPPLFYFLMHPVAVWAGPNPVLLRLPTLLMGLGAAWLTWAAVRRAFGGRAAGVALWLIVASAAHQHFSGEARPYALAMLFLSMALWGVVALARSYGEGAAPARQWALRAVWFAGILGGVFTHNLVVLCAPFWVIGSALAAWRASGRAREGVLLLALGGVAAAIYMPWFLVALEQVGLGDRQLGWMPRPTAAMMAGALFHLPMSWVRPAELMRLGALPVAISLAGAGALLVGAWSLRRRRGAGPVRLALACVVVAMALYYTGAHVTSHLKMRLVFAPRFAAILWVPWIFVVAALLAAIRPRAARLAAIALFVVPGFVDQAINLVVPIHPRTRAMLVRAAATMEPDETLYLFTPSQSKVKEIIFHAADLARREQVAPRFDALLTLLTPPHEGRPRRVLVGVWGDEARLRPSEPVLQAFDALRACAASATSEAWRLGGWRLWRLEEVAWERYRGRIYSEEEAPEEAAARVEGRTAGWVDQQ